MRAVLSILLFWAVGVLGCARPPSLPAPSKTAEIAVNTWPRDWSAWIGKTIELEGVAINAKLGAQLEGEGGERIWIDGLQAWPSALHPSSDARAKLRVRGTVIQRADLPVFVPAPAEPYKTGIPVETEAERDAARTRFLLEKATFTLLE